MPDLTKVQKQVEELEMLEREVRGAKSLVNQLHEDMQEAYSAWKKATRDLQHFKGEDIT